MSRCIDVKKNTIQDGTRRRGEALVNIRKNKRLQNLQKRRAMAPSSQKGTSSSGSTSNQYVSSSGNMADTHNKGRVATVAELPQIAAQIKSMTPEQRYEATRSVRRLLSRHEQPPAEDVIKAGLVPILVAELGLIKEEKTQFEAAWALTNIASTEHTRVIVQKGAVPYLVKLMMSKNPDIREQCLWCLGNVAGDGYDMRDLVLRVPGAMNNLLMNIKHASSESLLGNATWTLSNFCRGKPQPAIDTIKTALPYLAKLITHNKLDIVGDACWALSYISDGDDDRIQAVLDQNVIPTLVRLLQAEKVSVVTPALRTLGNIVSGSDTQTQAVIDGNCFGAFERLLDHSKRTVRKEACWALSNIAAGIPSQVDSLMEQKKALLRVLDIMETDDFEVRKEASWVISNICTGGSSHNIDKLVQMGAINTICEVLDVSDVKITLVALEALEAILRKGGSSQYADLVEQQGGVEKLEDLQDNDNEEVYKKAYSIIETYYGEDDDDEDEDEDENQDPVFSAPSGKGDTGAFSGFGDSNSMEKSNDIFGNVGGFGNNAPAVDWGF